MRHVSLHRHHRTIQLFKPLIRAAVVECFRFADPALWHFQRLRQEVPLWTRLSLMMPTRRRRQLRRDARHLLSLFPDQRCTALSSS